MFFPISIWCSLALFVSPSLADGKNAKRGLAFAAGDTPGDLVNANQTKSVITWIYDWGSLPLDYIAESNLAYVPMQWGGGSINNIGTSIKTQGAKVMLGFNEPDFVNESNMNATMAAALWMQYIQPLKQTGVRLGAPAVTAAPTGIPWLKDFMAACTNCTFDFIPFHWYGSGVGSFLDYLGQMHGTFPQHPLWVTEFAETSSNDTVVADFLNATTTYMDGQDFVERYAWFGYL
ncbi:hypothetical protein BD779DRAFT_1430686 [Infundibulicybe gibba]|nr:hypothetical protein BD779DRAFT_1430686 [Infundibulicybe gibba]